jgi:hypothetical protein
VLSRLSAATLAHARTAAQSATVIAQPGAGRLCSPNSSRCANDPLEVLQHVDAVVDHRRQPQLAGVQRLLRPLQAEPQVVCGIPVRRQNSWWSSHARVFACTPGPHFEISHACPSAALDQLRHPLDRPLAGGVSSASSSREPRKLVSSRPLITGPMITRPMSIPIRAFLWSCSCRQIAALQASMYTIAFGW